MVIRLLEDLTSFIQYGSIVSKSPKILSCNDDSMNYDKEEWESEQTDVLDVSDDDDDDDNDRDEGSTIEPREWKTKIKEKEVVVELQDEGESDDDEEKEDIESGIKMPEHGEQKKQKKGILRKNFSEDGGGEQLVVVAEVRDNLLKDKVKELMKQQQSNNFKSKKKWKKHIRLSIFLEIVDTIKYAPI